MGDDERAAAGQANIFGKRAGFGDLKKTFWDDERVKHDPKDTEDKDWANSEPDPNAP